MTAELARLRGQIAGADATRAAMAGDLGGARHELQAYRRRAEAARTRLANPGADGARARFEGLSRRAAKEGLTATEDVSPEDYDTWQVETTSRLNDELGRRTEQQRALANRITALMHRFRTDYAAETTDMDSAVASAHEYRRLHERLAQDDLPRFEADFKNYLNTNTIREVAGFQSALNTELELIRERIDRINESLLGIDYNPGRYIRLETQPSPSVEIRDFRHELRACTDNSLAGGDAEQYSEQKFLQVQRLIERFRGRNGQADADEAWTHRVTDVRNWVVFVASERRHEDDVEHESYADTAGKSGGQKEKLAYTILAASLAYQFKLDWGSATSRTFRFRRHRRGVRSGLGRVHALRAEPLPNARSAAAHRHAAAEDPHHRAVRRSRRLRRQPHRQLLAHADRHHRGVPATAGRVRRRARPRTRARLRWRRAGGAPAPTSSRP